MEVTFEMIDDILISVLSGELDHHSSSEIRENIDQTYDVFKAKHIILSFEEVTFMDSSGVGLIMGRYNKARERKGKIAIAGCNEHISRILEMAGIYTIAGCFASTAEAVAALQDGEGRNMERTNRIKVEMLSRSENEAIARNIAAVFITPLDPTMEEMTEIKTAVSEAVSNVMLHAYKGDQEGPIYLEMETTESGKVTITVEDRGVGIDDVQKAMEPLFTTGDSRERSGMGFTVMESFMDKVLVDSSPGKGTKVTLIKSLDRVYGF